ncbi:hypothetical protein AB3N02_22025 [Priestia aryabhattai]|uniref:hypothetical protein n=1 Tax=Priestia aryabhattai TaxID=412384 RepID=UPI0039A05780
MNTIKSQYGEYENYKGDIWISKQNPEADIQGTNIAVVSQFNGEGDVKVLAYVIREGGQFKHANGTPISLDEMVWSVLKATGWTDDYCKKLLHEDIPEVNDNGSLLSKDAVTYCESCHHSEPGAHKACEECGSTDVDIINE